MNTLGSINSILNVIAVPPPVVEYSGETINGTWPTNTWSTKTSAIISYGAAISETGLYQMYVLYSGQGSNSGVYISSDSGANFTQVSTAQIPSAGSCTACCMNSTGQYIAVTKSGTVYVSNDSGVTFAARTTYGGVSLAMSASGKYMLTAVGGGNIYYSENFGENWSLGGYLSGSAITQNWTSCRISDTRKAVFCATGLNVSYYSDNVGYTISASTGLPSATAFWYSICASRTGKYVTVAATYAFAGPANHYSEDYGHTFTASNSGDCIAVDCSGSGQYQIALRLTRATQYSKDYGHTWANISPAVTYSSGDRGWIALSANGTRAIFSGYNNIVRQYVNT